MKSPEEIREIVDARYPRCNKDGSINAQHVAAEITLREQYGHPNYIARLDGPGKYRSTGPGPWDAIKATVLNPSSWKPGVIRTVLTKLRG